MTAYGKVKKGGRKCQSYPEFSLKQKCGRNMFQQKSRGRAGEKENCGRTTQNAGDLMGPSGFTSLSASMVRDGDLNLGVM